MYHSNPLYTGNTGLSNCILGMSNLTADIHMHTKYGMVLEKNFHKIFVGWYFWRLGETSKFRVARDEQMLILLVCLQDRPRRS